MKNFLLVSSFSIITIGCTPQLPPEVIEARNNAIKTTFDGDLPFLVDQCVDAFIHKKPLNDPEFEARKYTNFTLGFSKSKHFKKAFPEIQSIGGVLAFNGSSTGCGMFIGGYHVLHAFAEVMDKRLQSHGFERTLEKRVFNKGYIYKVDGREVILLGKQVISHGAVTTSFKLRPRLTSSG